MRTIRIGTRGSKLALWQANYVKKALKKNYPEVHLEQVIIKTEGDLDQKSSLTRIGGQGVFTKEIEKALLNKEIDIAVHSLKDLPSKMPEGLTLAAVPERGPVEDILITRTGKDLEQLPSNAKIATGSIRRKSQLLNMMPDLKISDLRGNINTRLKKLESQGVDAIIMAKAAVIRLELSGVRYSTFSTEVMVPAVGQGAIGIQIRSDDPEVHDLIKVINHWETYQSVTAERSLLATLDSGCQFPVGAFARIRDHVLKINGFVASEDGRIILYDQVETDPQKAEEAGRSLARKLIDQGAGSVLATFTANLKNKSGPMDLKTIVGRDVR